MDRITDAHADRIGANCCRTIGQDTRSCPVALQWLQGMEGIENMNKTTNKQDQAQEITAEISHEIFKNDARRKITETWTTPENYRVKVYTYHDKAKKIYWSIVATCTVQESGTIGIYFEYSSSQTDVSRLAGKVSATRYNFNRMDEAHASAVESVRDLVASLLDQVTDTE